jgi:ABC-type Fe3+-hydroxamate transport system substrate-binding protein
VISVRDAMGVEVGLEAPARRVISLVPSVTETLFKLGCGPQVLACTTFCIHPRDGVAALPKVGGTKDPDVARIVALGPDLVLANREENRREDVDALRGSVAVHVSYPRDLRGLLEYLADLGTLLGAEARAREMADAIVAARRAFPLTRRPVRVLYLIWRKPWMAAGPDTFIDGMLAAGGFQNAVGDGGGRYPEIDPGRWRGAIDAVLLSSEPFPFGEQHRGEVAAVTGLDRARVQLVSGEAFSWFGCRTAGAFAEAARVHGLLGD